VVAKDPNASRNELDLFAEMDDAKAKELIQIFVQHKTALTPTFNIQHVWHGFPSGVMLS
jgi:alpha-ketoglutarate-dependent taurine dioxygenase